MEKDLLELSQGLLNSSRHNMQGSSRAGKSTTSLRNNILKIIITYFAGLLTVFCIWAFNSAPTLPYSPANHLLVYENKPAWDKGDDSPFLHGEPHEIENAWQDLQQGLNVRLSKDIMRKTQDNWEEVNDGVELIEGDFLAGLGVYHSIHCLYLLRVAVNRDKFNISDPNALSDLNTHHYNHCIDFIRDAILCQPDLTIYRGTWIADSHEHQNKRLRSTSQRQCAKWDPIAQWARERVIDESDQTLRVRPGPYEKRPRPAQNAL